MRKIAFLFAFAIALTAMTSCGNGSTATTNSADSTKVDSVKVDTAKTAKTDTAKVKADSAAKSSKSTK